MLPEATTESVKPLFSATSVWTAGWVTMTGAATVAPLLLEELLLDDELLELLLDDELLEEVAALFLLLLSPPPQAVSRKQNVSVVQSVVKRGKDMLRIPLGILERWRNGSGVVLPVLRVT